MLDLDPRSRRALEFDELLSWLAEFARTAEGARRVRELVPERESGRIRELHDAVLELRRCSADAGPPIPSGLPDVGSAVAALAVAGARLTAERLRDVALVAAAASRVGVALRGLAASDFPLLAERGRGFPDLLPRAEVVLRCIEPDGTINDSASPGLRRLRAERARLADRLRRHLEGLIREPGAEAVFREDFVTQRNGRFVVPVRTDTPRPLRGIVHGSSSSGATQFVEPLESVEANNELVRLEEQEQQEQERLLALWSESFHEQREELVASLEALAALDALQARALFGNETRGVAPDLDDGAGIELDGMRHPLLDRRLQHGGNRCVPIDLHLTADTRVLVLSGPNTGGKTVALKTCGLALLMAQSGIPLPARRVRLAPQRQVRADIGDHQSIQADLSTFSAHVRALVEFLEHAAPPALFLFDEIGTGTEPTEGAALAQSVLEELLRRRVTTLATTHHAALKSWAFTTDGAVSAALEFDTAALRPTYRILMGAAGVSAGLQIAARLGVDPRIVHSAEARLGGDARRTAAYLERLHDLTVDLERRLAAAEAREAELGERRRALDEQTAAAEVQRAEEVQRTLTRTLEQLRRESRRALAAIEDQVERRRAEKAAARLDRELAQAVTRATVELRLADPAADEAWGPAERIVVGLEVRVHSLGRQGRVQRVRGDRVDVQLGNLVLAAPRADLRVRRGAAVPADQPARRESTRYPEDHAPQELLLLGRRVEEGLAELDRFLDGASVAGHGEVRIVHGHGTGKLRSAVRRHLRGRQQVESFRPGRPEEGGDGATVVRLKGEAPQSDSPPNWSSQ